jgi:hypothetical protein
MVGEGGLAEFVATLKEDEAAYGFVRYMFLCVAKKSVYPKSYSRMSFANDELSQRAKFVFISWVGQKVKVMRKAKISVRLFTSQLFIAILNINQGPNG